MTQGNIRPEQAGETAKEARGSARELAEHLIRLSGGFGNVLEAIHCTTRLRLRLRDSSLVDEAGLSGMQEVQGVFFRAEQLQIILGSANVFKVHRHIVRILQDGGPTQQEEVQSAGFSESISPDSTSGSKRALLPCAFRQIVDAVSFFPISWCP